MLRSNDMSNVISLVESIIPATSPTNPAPTRRRDTYTNNTSFARAANNMIAASGPMDPSRASIEISSPVAVAPQASSEKARARDDAESVVVFSGRGVLSRKRSQGAYAGFNKDAVLKRIEVEEIRNLLVAMRDAKCWHWTLVLASMLI
ncbi:hypothetical protein HK096_002163, partial [Nowakowskiella sp. JEL0078]